MNHPFFRLKETLTLSFTGTYLLLQLGGALLTYLIVTSGFDFMYYLTFKNTFIEHFFFSAVIVGGILPIVLPIWFLIYGSLFKNKKISLLGAMLSQAVVLGWSISSLYKAFTGRVPPSHSLNTLIDISRDFQFGWLQGGIFWGWPSSHTTIAFAMACTIWSAYPKHNIFKYLAIIYAVYIGFGVSLSIHWFSDAVAGAILGTVIGLSIGKSFTEKLK